MTGISKQALTWAIVPLKSAARAKSRFASVLDPERRVHLFFALAKQGIVALKASKSIDAVAVVTSSLEVAAFAAELGAVPILQSADIGMSAALQWALHGLQSARPRRVLMLPGDLPLISAAAIDEVVSAAGNTEECLRRASHADAHHASVHIDPARGLTLGSEEWDAGASVVIVPDRHREGTNALLCSPPDALTPRFGPRSFERHLADARTSGLLTRILEIEALALDLDCLDDLEHLRQHGGQPAEHLLRAAVPHVDHRRALLAGATR
jgi:2-phospho-L-lactate guanylyltransferase